MMWLRAIRIAPCCRHRLFSTAPSPYQLLATSLLDNGRQVQVSIHSPSTSTSTHTFHACWLRDNAPSHRQAGTGQRVVFPSTDVLQRRVMSAAATAASAAMHVVFDDGHRCDFPLSWLLQHSYSQSCGRESLHNSNSSSSKKMLEVPRLSFEHVTGSDQGRLEWHEAVARHGLCVVEQVPRESGQVVSLARRLTGAEVMSQLYGPIFDVEAVPDPINIAYTAEELDLHMDLAYYESPPGIQFLHCLHFDDSIKGGDSTFADAFAAAEMLRERDPQSFETLTRVPATFQKDHMRRANPAQMYYQRPHISVDATGQILGIFWSPPFEGPLKVAPDQVMPYYRAYVAFRELLTHPDHFIRFRLRPGDAVCFNQRRMLHGRTGFAGQEGKRHLQGTYVMIDEFVNRLRVLRLLSGRDWEGLGNDGLRRIGNSSWTP